MSELLCLNSHPSATDGCILSLNGAKIHINGVVQGVGFRPFIYQLAKQMGLNGWVRNSSSGVDIEIDAEREQIEDFIQKISQEKPPLARIDNISVQFCQPFGFADFFIQQSLEEAGKYIPISADVSICEDCLAELFNPKDRRYRYPFINCTNCGPRFTIIKDIPYDRPKTTMSDFLMCEQCAEEYHNPLNRRFHAQPIACPICGPHIWFEDRMGKILAKKEDAIQVARQYLIEGKILAIKGLGGFHLACDASNAKAVDTLRKRKLRIDKPFAVMVFSELQAKEIGEFDDASLALLKSRERPIVLVSRVKNSSVTVEVSPNQNSIGVMLPYTPLHYLLLEVEQGFPSALVMTSGNLSEEPIALSQTQAYEQLSDIVDGFIFHNRHIHTRCDDSVMRVFEGKNVFIRRSRGFAPLSIELPFKTKQIFAAGAELKNTFCFSKERYAFISQHIGNMENYETYQSYEEAVLHFEKLFRINPELLVHDFHPDYLSTHYVYERAEADGLPILGVQHHHAHITACMAEHQIPIDQPVLGVALDGSGYGLDGTLWGGEFIIADYYGFLRAYHLSTIEMIGGERAIYEPWRLAYAWLHKIGFVLENEDIPIKNYLYEFEHRQRKLDILRQQLQNKINSPKTSSMGRLFDAAASILGIRHEVNYEAQAAIEMENMARLHLQRGNYFEIEEHSAYPFETDGDVINIIPIIMGLLEDIKNARLVGECALRFHWTIALLVADVCEKMRETSGLNSVCLSGGVWQNMLLLEFVVKVLRKRGFKVLYHQKIPTNDGGISLGQIASAAVQAGRVIL